MGPITKRKISQWKQKSEMMKLADKNFKMATISMFKEIKKNMNIRNAHIKKWNQMEILKIKRIISARKISLMDLTAD